VAEQKQIKSEPELSRDLLSGLASVNDSAEPVEEPAPSRHKPVKRLFATLHNPLPPVEGKAFTNGACKKPRFPLRQLQFAFALLAVSLASGLA
jgi:hypothetical protein